jgi:hypothetical protein
MYDDDAYRAELRAAVGSLRRFALILSGLCAAGAAIWLLIRWLA